MSQQELSWPERGSLWMRIGIRLVLLVFLVLFLLVWAPPLLSLFMPFVLALVMAWLLHPIIRWIQKRLKLPRGMLSLLLILLVFAVAGGALFAFCYSAATEIKSLADNWQTIWQGGQEAMTAVAETLELWLGYLPAEIEVFANQGIQNLSAWLQTALPAALSALAARAGSFAMSIPSFVMAAVVFVMAAYFITADYPHLRFLVTDRLSQGAKSFLSRVKSIVVDAFGGYVRAQVILTLGVFVILIIGFLVTGQEYALLLALILAVLDFIPIIGSGTAMVPWAVVDLCTGDYLHAVQLMAIWGLVSLFRRIGEPKIVGSQTGLSPVLSLVSIYVGMKLGGVLGMILGPVLCLVVLNLGRAGVFDGISSDLRLAVTDTAAILRHRPATEPNEEKSCSKTSSNSFKKD